MQLSDRITGSAIAVLGATVVAGASFLPPMPGQQIGPSAFPMLIGGGLVVSGVLIMAGIGHTFEAPSDATDPAEAAAPPTERLAAWRLAVPPLLLLFYVLVVDWLGFLPTAALVVLAVSRVLDASWRLALPLSIGAAIAVQLIFGKLLRVALPPGLLPAPW